MTASDIILSDIFAIIDGVLGTLRLRDLVIAFARLSIALLHVPLFEPARGNVLPKQHVECGVDVLVHVIADEDNAIEAFEYHADLWGGVPAVMAACRMKGCVEAMASTTAHSCEKTCSIGAVVGMFVDLAENCWDVEVRRGDAAFLMSLIVAEVATVYCQREPSMDEKGA